MTVLDNRVISILARRAPQVTVVQAQNICTDLSEQGLLPGLIPPVDTSSEAANLYLLQNNFIKETSTSPEDEPDKEEVERLCDEARREGTKTDDVARGLGRPRTVEGFTHEEAMKEIKRLRKYEDYVIESGFVLGFKQWAEH